MITVDKIERVTIVGFSGQRVTLDESALEQIGDEFVQRATLAAPPLVLLDMRPVSFIGSRFIEMMIRVWKLLKKRGGRLALCGLQPFCAEVLERVRVNTLCESYADREEALAALTGSPDEQEPA